MTAKRKKRILWRRARRQIKSLLVEHNHRCHWCKEPIEYVRNTLLLKRCGRGLYRNAVGRVIRAATVDHLIPLSQGGDNDRRNLVPACEPCNHTRQSRPGETDVRPKRLRKFGSICVRCLMHAPTDALLCESCNQQLTQAAAV